MDREEIIRMARKAGMQGMLTDVVCTHKELARFAALVTAAEREKVATWMMQRGYATGHGDSIEDLLKELDWQIRESEREACAKVCDVLAVHPEYASDITKVAAQAIRARGNT
jgi:2-oxo-4-hydroxy-4-carboxy--5-ureidoimidazoline (OHCU) decarboxylase